MRKLAHAFIVTMELEYQFTLALKLIPVEHTVLTIGCAFILVVENHVPYGIEQVFSTCR